MFDCSDEIPNIGWNCDSEWSKEIWTTAKLNMKKDRSWVYEHMEWEPAYWVQKDQYLKKYNYETEQMEYWIAQKDIPSSIDFYWNWRNKRTEKMKTKLITAQANFELLNNDTV